MDGSWSLRTKRSSVRLPLELPVIIERDQGQAKGLTRNIGLGGAFIDAAEPLVYDERIRLWLPLHGTEALACLPSVVRWFDPRGFGVQFLELGASEAYALTQLMRAMAPAR
jgi:PilZ domain